ncbi:hypothetical protein B0H14DRAFT_3473392 [Mycena olivaceomarginata]|nr:hypothetical protein B0H14DRAFT_3473392 [Mycena olivaceomarginata]
MASVGTGDYTRLGAITSSTFLPVPSQYEYNDRIAELLYSEVIVQANCTSATDAFSCLQTVNATALETGQHPDHHLRILRHLPIRTVVDGSFITQRPTASLLQGAVNGEMLDSASLSSANKVGSLYAGLGTQLFQESAIIGESTLICPTYYLLRPFHDRAFKAEFVIPPGLHSYDVPYYFPQHRDTVSFMSFGVSISPNVKIDPTTITPPWKKWEARHTEMLFNSTAAGLPSSSQWRPPTLCSSGASASRPFIHVVTRF